MAQPNMPVHESLSKPRENSPFESKEPEKHEWPWSELMSEEQARRLREVSRKKALKAARAAARRS